MSLAEYIIDQEAKLIDLTKSIKIDKINRLKACIEKIENKSVTPTSDAIARHFPLGQVGFNKRTLAKKKRKRIRKRDSKIKKFKRVDI